MNLILEKAYEKVCGNCKACICAKWQDCVKNTFNYRRCPFEDEIAGIEDSAKIFLEFVNEIAEKLRIMILMMLEVHRRGFLMDLWIFYLAVLLEAERETEENFFREFFGDDVLEVEMLPLL